MSVLISNSSVTHLYLLARRHRTTEGHLLSLKKKKGKLTSADPGAERENITQPSGEERMRERDARLGAIDRRREAGTPAARLLPVFF